MDWNKDPFLNANRLGNYFHDSVKRLDTYSGFDEIMLSRYLGAIRSRCHLGNMAEFENWFVGIIF